MQYINNNFSEIVSIEDVASNLYVSYSYLRSVFKKEVGITVYDFLISVRMEEAKKLLSSTKTPISEISEKTGYSDCEYFKTVFIKYNGMTPNNFRIEHKKQQTENNNE